VKTFNTLQPTVLSANAVLANGHRMIFISDNGAASITTMINIIEKMEFVDFYEVQ